MGFMNFLNNVGNFVKENAGKIAGVTAGIILTPVTGGTSLVFAYGAVGFLAGSFVDADIQKRDQENNKLALAGKAGEAIQGQVNNLQNQRNQIVQESEDLIKELQKHKTKLNDPDATPEEKDLAKKLIPIIQSQLDEKTKQISDYDKKIEDLLKSIPGSDKGGLANFQPDTQTKLIIGGVVFLVAYLVLVKDKE